jgi:hypothetical protein
MRKIILIFFIILEIGYSDASSDKINRLNKRLEKVNHKLTNIKNNTIKYNHLMTEYKKISSKYQKLINLCKKDKCLDDSIELKKNFLKLKQSVRTLDDMMETDRASIRSLEKQKKLIEGLIRMEKAKATLTREEVETVIDVILK